jgi:hypothetical protein
MIKMTNKRDIFVRVCNFDTFKDWKVKMKNKSYPRIKWQIKKDIYVSVCNFDLFIN